MAGEACGTLIRESGRRRRVGRSQSGGRGLCDNKLWQTVGLRSSHSTGKLTSDPTQRSDLPVISLDCTLSSPPFNLPGFSPQDYAPNAKRGFLCELWIRRAWNAQQSTAVSRLYITGLFRGSMEKFEDVLARDVIPRIGRGIGAQIKAMTMPEFVQVRRAYEGSFVCQCVLFQRGALHVQCDLHGLDSI